MTSSKDIEELDKEMSKMTVSKRPTGDDHWTRKVKMTIESLQAENVLLKSENARLLNALRGADGGDGGDDGDDDGDGDGNGDGDDDDDDGSPPSLSTSDEERFNITVQYLSNTLLTLEVDGDYIVDNVKVLIADKEGIPRKHQKLTFNSLVLDEHLTLTECDVVDGSQLVLSIRGTGGAPKKRKASSNINPFSEDEATFPTATDTALFQEAFTSSIQMAALNKDQIDLKTIFTSCDGTSLDFILSKLTTGRAHHTVKIESIVESIPFVQSVKQVSKMLENSYEKYKRLMSSKLWDLGCVDGAFKMESLTSFINGVRALK
ncbi:unnamed protein product [Effrenium voratum]|nr:unnamed protein product [Effrenium voratum]